MTGRSVVNRPSNSGPDRPCGCSLSSVRRMRSTTFTTRIRRSGNLSRKDGDCSHRFQRGHVAAARHHDVGRAHLLRAGPRPDPNAARAVLNGLVHRQPVERRLLAGHDDVHVVAAAQAVVCYRQETVGIRRQVDANVLCLLVEDHVEEARVLVAEAVVILSPNVAAQQVVERRDRACATGCRATTRATWRAG